MEVAQINWESILQICTMDNCFPESKIYGLKQTLFKFMISMEKRPWVARGIKQGLAQASQQYSFPKLGRRRKVRVAAQSVFTFGETKHQDGVWLTKSWFGRTLQNKVCFHSAPDRLEEIGIQSCFSNEAASFLLPKWYWGYLGSQQGWVSQG